MRRLTMALVYLLGLAGFGGLSLKVHAPQAQKNAVTVAMAAIAEDVDLKGQVDVQYDHLRAVLFGRVSSDALRDRAADVVEKSVPTTTSIENHIRLVGDLNLPADKRTLQQEMTERFRTLVFPGGRSDLAVSADESLRVAVSRIREVDPNLPLLLISRGHDEESIALGLKRCGFVRKRMVAFGLSSSNIGVICEPREGSPSAENVPQVLLLILE